MQDPSVRGNDTSLPGSLRRLLSDVFIALSQRVALVSVEMRIAQRRALYTTVAGVVGAAITLLAILLLTAGAIVLIWPENIGAALLIAGGIYLFFGLITGLYALMTLRKRPLPLESLLEVLKEDKAWLAGQQPD